MITKYIRVYLLIFIIQSGCQFLYSQGNTQSNNDRYLIFNDLQNMFIQSDDNFTIESFQLYNIKDDESSKPIHIAVNETSGVVKFSIESGSSIYENQRRCKLVISKVDYVNTFRMVLYNMGVKYIIHNGTSMEVEEFIKLLKN